MQQSRLLQPGKRQEFFLKEVSMSRTPKNKGLKALCRQRDLQIADLACLTESNGRSIHFYSTGRKACPILEEKLAKVFKMSVPDLRKKLGLENWRNRK